MRNSRFAARIAALVLTCAVGFTAAVSASAQTTASMPRVYAAASDKSIYSSAETAENAGVKPAVYQASGSTLTPSGASLPSSYRSNTTDIRSQGSYNTCWAFANIAALETFLIKDGKGTHDLSEQHLSWWSTNEYNSDGVGWQFDSLFSGGYSMIGAGYLISWQGAKTEEALPYSEYGSRLPDNMDIEESPFNVTGMIYVANDIQSVKTAVMEYGAVATSYNSAYGYNSDNSTYYQGNETDMFSGHAIAIVGWDDDYPKENFTTQPPYNGAWLIKNSWGEYMGDNGYLWISYYDRYLLDTDVWGSNIAVTSVRTNTGYDRLYQNEIYGATYYTYMYNDMGSYFKTLTFANVFDFDEEHKYLEKVIFETRETGVSYTVYYIPVEKNAPVADRAEWVKLAAGKSNSSGYICIDTGSFEVPSGKGAIGITVDSGDSGEYASIGVDEWLTDYSDKYVFLPDASKQKSFVIDGSSVYDLMDIYKLSDDDIGGMLVIKAVASSHIVGDVSGDGKSSTADALFVLRNSIGLKDFDSEQMINGDTNFDGKISAVDALIIQRKAVGLISDY